MSSQIVLPLGTYPVGSYDLGPATVPLGVTDIKIELVGTSMTDPVLHVEVTLDLSLDGGVTWNAPHPDVDPFPCGMVLSGGALDRQGLPLPIYSLSCGTPDPTNPDRRVRAHVVISGTALITQGTLVLT
jgi:hypothetical protein